MGIHTSQYACMQTNGNTYIHMYVHIPMDFVGCLAVEHFAEWGGCGGDDDDSSCHEGKGGWEGNL
jgi:hypothetical protein